MSTYRYKAIDQQGRQVSGELESESASAAEEILAARGFIPSSIRESRGDGGWDAFKMRFVQVKARDLIIFTKQFSTMIRAGVPMLQVLDILENQTENPKLRRCVAAVSNDIKRGSSLYEAMSKHPRVFSSLYCSMVHAGESSGALPDILERLIYVIDHEDRIKTDIKSALQYPALVVASLVVAFAVLLTFVIPRFARMFEQADIQLPLPTRICLLLSHGVTSYWYLILGGLLVVVVGVAMYVRTEKGELARDRLFLSAPIIGPVLGKAAVSRFASIFAILQSSGVAILDCMKILAGTIGNAAIARELAIIEDLLEEGRGIAGPLRSARYFTPMLVNMVAIGEESGNLDEMLREVSAHYDTEVEYAMKKMADSIGPILIVALAVLVGFFALAIYMPMWDLARIAGG